MSGYNPVPTPIPADATPTPIRERLAAFGRRALGEDRMRFLAVIAQLGLVLVVANLFALERDYGFLRLTPVIFVGFVVHALLPKRLRLPFFLLLSLAGIGLLLGRTQTALLVGLGLGLIGICHLPVKFSVRVGLLLLAALGLAAVRGEWIALGRTPLWAFVLPVLGSMFMFRLIIYMYELRHEKQPASIWERLSYFFMLPNVCFLLFPVVDYRTFRRTYYDQDANDIYQKGVTWIFRGVTHLLLYRLIYYELLPAASDVTTLAGVVQYMVATYLLYLRISGQFHLVIGIMCLFGFNLPETHHLYFLASSFNDYWRRINIYWKDFMMKIFYYPSLNKLRVHGLGFAIVVSTLIVFAGTWVLHSYQWFWLQGQFPLTVPDALFWGILGILVVFNSLREMKRGRRRRLTTSSFSWARAFQYSARVAGMFVTITLLWALWSSDTLAEYGSLLRVAGAGTVLEWMLLVAALMLLVGIGTIMQYVNGRGISFPVAGSAPSFRRTALSTTAGLAVLLLLALPQSKGRTDSTMQTMLVSLHSEGLNQQDEGKQLMGYYEGLLDSRRYIAARWNVRGRAEAPADWGDLTTSIISQETGDIRRIALRPLAEDRLFRAPFKVNRWGMRDRDYAKEKPDSTFRVAFIGASYTVGAGVEQEGTFEARIEKRLNRELGGRVYARFESLNFAVGGYDPVRTLVDVKKRVLAFEPDLVCYVAHSSDEWRMRQNIASTVENGFDLVEPHVEAVVRQAGIDASTPRTEMERRLTPFMPDLIRWAYVSLSDVFLQHDIEHVAFVLPRVIQAGDGPDAEHLRLPFEMLRETGFHTYNLAGVYGEVPTSSLWLGPWDEHPNARGHQLIADRMYRELIRGGHIRGGSGVPLRATATQEGKTRVNTISERN